MTRPAILFAMLAAAAFAVAPAARADYAVLRSGVRLHITGYERTGDRMALMVAGGTAEVAASDVVAIEPEEVFPASSPAGLAITGPYAKLIHNAAAKHGVDETLIQRVIAAESNFNPRAISRRDALGLMQLLPETAARYSVANVFDPEQNIDGGTRYLKDLLEQYRGNLPLALAAYNAGPDTVERYGGIPPFPETQSYVRRITAELGRMKARGTKNSYKPTQLGAVNRDSAVVNLQKSALDATFGLTAAGAVVGSGAAPAGAPSAEPELDRHRP
jgi:soluble lytic murein transglycosylase-like protein